MYLRASKVELEASGESAEGCADSVSELQGKLKALTGVDVMKSNDEFKSTYQILKEIAEVWGDLTDIQRASVTELIGGKRSANAVAAIIEGFDVAENTLKATAGSAGNAWKENEVYLDSIQGKMSQLSAAFESLSYHTIDSGPVKALLSAATAVIKLTDGLVKLSGVLPVATGMLSGFLSAMQATGKIKDGAGKVNMPSYTHCLIEYRMQHLKYTPRLLETPKALSLTAV